MHNASHFPILCIPNARYTTIPHRKATQEDTHNQNTPIYLKLATYTDLSGCSSRSGMLRKGASPPNKHQDKLMIGQATSITLY